MQSEKREEIIKLVCAYAEACTKLRQAQYEYKNPANIPAYYINDAGAAWDRLYWYLQEQT
jgi:hypothetical protein